MITPAGLLGPFQSKEKVQGRENRSQCVRDSRGTQDGI